MLLIVICHSLHPSAVYAKFKISDLILFPNFNPDISKKIEALAKKKSCAVLGDWKQSISNHLYWCAASSSGDGKQVEAKWLSISNHVTNVHEGHSEAFPRCSHGPLQQERKWLRRGKTNQ